MRKFSGVGQIAFFLVVGTFAGEIDGVCISDEEVTSRIVRCSRFEDVEDSVYKDMLQQCDYDTNRFFRIARELYATNSSARVRSEVLSLFWMFGTHKDKHFLEACVLDPRHGEYSLRILRRIEGVCSNSVDQLVRFQLVTDDMDGGRLISDKGAAFRGLANAIQELPASASLRQYFAKSIPLCMSNNVEYAWMGDQCLRELDATYPNSRRRLSLLRFAMPLQTVERLRAAMSAAICELEAYPEADLPE